MKKGNDNKKLNKEQLTAVRFGDGPLLIVAGAGTGKTTVITERIKNLIKKEKAKPAEILALTFTEKAAREMETRVDMALPYGYTQMWITTFHAFGERVLRQDAINIGLDPGFKLMTSAESVIFFRKNLFSFNLNYFRPLGNPNKFIGGILSHFNRLKDEDITPLQYGHWVDSFLQKKTTEKEEADKYLELAQAYRKYEELKVKNGLMDFSDLISNTLTLFRTRKNILDRYCDQFKYVLIDEFQDTNFAQNELAILLSGKRKNITVVGDDDQAIYRWRGAAISNIIQFRSRFPDTKMVVLTKNYRSTGEILNSAYTLIQKNNPDRLEIKEHLNKKLTPERKKRGSAVELIYTERVEDEAEEVVKKIIKLKNNSDNLPSAGSPDPYGYNDFAILVRANNYADPFVRSLERAGIPYQFLGPGMLFRQPEVKDLIAYLKFLSDLTDSVALFRVLSMSVFGLPSREMAEINNFARRMGLTTYEALEVIVAHHNSTADHWSLRKNYGSYLPHLSEATKRALSAFLEMVERHLSLTVKETAGQLLYYFLEDTGILKQMTEFKTASDEKKALNISKLFDKLKSFEVENEEAGITAVVDWIDMAMELGESPLAADTDWTENDAVNILTIHASKGLEFPVVFLVNLVQQRFPTGQRKEQIPIPDDLVKEILPEGDYHLEEERRLFYVGMTRARDSLFLTAANYYGEGKRERKISPFIIDTLGEKVVSRQKKSGIKQLALLEWRKKEEPEKPVIRQPLEYLSYSQIETFLTCPLQYKYRYLLKIPVPRNAAGSFGSSVHLALQKFYEKVKRGEKPLKEDLLNLFTDVWIPVGYGTKKYEESMKERGRIMLTTFYDTAYNPGIIPLSLEQVFKIRLTPALKLGGKIDRIDLNGGKMEIIDYKTGKRPKESEIRENLQMTVYALAATDPGIYNKKPEDVIFSFYFFDGQEKISSTRTKAQLEEAREKLIKTAGDIMTSKMEAKVGPWCNFCDFRLICEAWQK